MMNGTLIAVILMIGFTLSFATSNAYASGWDKDPWYATPISKKINKSQTETYDVRQVHVKGWHGSKVCGIELCSDKTATESMSFHGLKISGAKTSIKGAFDGKFYVKGNFTIKN
jgi:hypothetical protein